MSQYNSMLPEASPSFQDGCAEIYAKNLAVLRDGIVAKPDGIVGIADESALIADVDARKAEVDWVDPGWDCWEEPAHCDDAGQDRSHARPAKVWMIQPCTCSDVSGRHARRSVARVRSRDIS